MKNLTKAELFKLKKSTAYRTLFIIFLLTEIIVQINNIGNSVAYPKYNPTYTGIGWLSELHRPFSIYAITLFLFAAFFVNGDFTGRTFYASLLCGTERKNAFGAKMISVFAGGVPLALVSLLPGTILWSIHTGFGMDFGIKAAFLIIKAFVWQILISFAIISHTVFFAVIAKSKTSTFVWSFGSLYVVGVLRANIGRIIPNPALGEILKFLVSLYYLNIWTFLASVLLKLLAAGYIFEKFDLK
ncbi:hypothetical protein D7V86_06870 [bacterium D16-51]|nr:hypothetical protein D7V96_07300 [bacterium D16-59]RKI61035.1 hypothetical protein D7V86_06870 [bacterium D16-51]